MPHRERIGIFNLHGYAKINLIMSKNKKQLNKPETLYWTAFSLFAIGVASYVIILIVRDTTRKRTFTGNCTL